MRPLLTALVLAGLTAAGCSLVGLDDVEVPQCTVEGEQCRALNARDDIRDDACRLYQCFEGTCRFAPRDIDQDGFVPPRCASELPECGGPVACTDCDDENGAVNGSQEVCDGFDNDCNGLIDDLTGESATPTVLLEMMSGIGPNVGGGYVHYGTTFDKRSVAVVHAEAERAGFDLITTIASSARSADKSLEFTTEPGGALSMPFSQCPNIDVVEPPLPPTPAPVDTDPPRTCATHEECSDGDPCNGNELCDPDSAFVDELGCRPADNVCAMGTACNVVLGGCVPDAPSRPCSFGDVASAQYDDGSFFVASIDTDGCGSGSVRIGALSSAESPTRVVLAGGLRRSTAYRTLDPDERGCTGGSRPEGDPVGAASIEIAALPAVLEGGGARVRAQGLAAWIAAPFCRSAPDGTEPCPTDPDIARVEVLGLFEESVRIQGEATVVGVVNATNDGRGQALDVETSGIDRPAVVAVDQSGWAGYLVAYPRAGGGIVLHPIGAPDPPAEVMRRHPYETRLPADTGARSTDPITTIGDAVVLGGAAEVERVRLAVADPVDGRTLVGIAWTEAGRVSFGVLELSAAGGVVDVADEAFAPIELADGRDVLALSLAYADVGIYASHAEEELRGGWFVVWTDPFAVLGHRVAMETLAPVGEAFIVGNRESYTNPAVAVLPREAEGDPGPRVLAHDADSDALVAFPGVCGQP